jgi:hypothetical protein
MKIEANDRDISDVFKLGYFKIPRFQRPYSWEKDEVDNFWADVVEGNSKEYFIGSMVVYQDKKPYFGIVDGQQRLTTITLILSAIRDAFLELGEENLARGVHKYVEQPNIDNENEFVLNTETSYPYLQNHIQSFSEQKLDLDVGTEEKNLKFAFELINQKIKNAASLNDSPLTQIELLPLANSPIEILKEIRDKVLSLKLVFIQLDNEEDAYLIFETLNARGRDLRSSDLIKNLLLKTIKKSSASIDTPKESWNNLINKFDDINENDGLDSFLLHYWISKESYCTDKELFSKVKEAIVDKDKAHDFLKDLNKHCDLYCKMLNPTYFNWDKNSGSETVKSALISLKRFKVKQQSSFVLALLRAYDKNVITLNNLKSTMEKIELFHFIFNAITSQRSSGQIVSTYSKNAINLSKATNANQASLIYKDLFDALSKKIPNYDEFEVKFLELTFLKNKTKDKNIIKYCLSKLMPNNINCLDINFDNLSIEHIIPQTNTDFNSDVIGNIGNLILVDQKTNSERLKDKTPKNKFIILKESGYPLDESLIIGEEWSEDDILRRAKLIATKLYKQTLI